jgi:hypothetical protein
VEKVEFGVGEEDRKRLLNFIDTFQKFINNLIEEDSYFLAHFQVDYKPVWLELGPHFSALKDGLQRADTSVLLAYGLLGNQLGFKLKVVNYFAKEFFLYGIELIGGHKLLENLFASMGHMLEGMVAAAGTGQAIIGFKNSLQVIIKNDS